MGSVNHDSVDLIFTIVRELFIAFTCHAPFLCMCVNGMPAPCEGQRMTFGVDLCLLPCLKRDLCGSSTVYSWLAGPPVFMDSPVSATHLPVRERDTIRLPLTQAVKIQTQALALAVLLPTGHSSIILLTVISTPTYEWKSKNVLKLSHEWERQTQM